MLGVDADVEELRFDRWPRIDDAIESYAAFRALRDEGVIPAHLRFQLSASPSGRARLPASRPTSPTTLRSSAPRTRSSSPARSPV